MTGRHRAVTAAVLGLDVVLLLATSEPPPAATTPDPAPRCATVELRSDPYPVDDAGDLVLELVAPELGAVEGSVWVFADPERACRAEVVLGEIVGAVSVPGLGDDGGVAPSPEAVVSWIGAGSAWQVPVALDGADGPVVLAIGACPGAEVELELEVHACGEVVVEAQ